MPSGHLSSYLYYFPSGTLATLARTSNLPIVNPSSLAFDTAMASSYSSPVSPSTNPGSYVSILSNIKRKAVNAGARPADFEDHLHSVLLIVNGPQYHSYSDLEKVWHIDLFMWEHFCKSHALSSSDSHII
jgi:hypothetical protein